MPIAPGSRIGPYEVVSHLGGGGMGEVWRARDSRLDREVAIKVLKTDLASDPALRARFEREARTISRLSHPNICTLYDVGRHDGFDFLVMELLDGETLADRLDRGPLPLGQLTRIGGEIAAALAAAHRHGAVHRDLKPANVLLTRNGAKVLDFGLAKLAAAPGFAPAAGAAEPTLDMPQDRPLTAEGSILGTLQYMAPEQVEGQEADARSDVFALGAVLYEMATGRRPFGGRSRASLIAQILEHDPPPLSSLQPLAPPALERLVAACLAKEPDERFQSARDVALELAWLGEGAMAPAASRRSGRLGWWSAAAALLLAALLGALLVFGPRAVQEPRELDLAMPEGLRVVAADAPPTLSPDGMTLAFGVAAADGELSIALRRLDRREIRLLDATTGGFDPFWAPDGRSLGFFTEDALHRVDLASGLVRRLAEIGDGRGGTWSASGTILLSPVPDAGLFRVSAGGGPLEPVAAADASAGERGFWRPQFLDAERYLYAVMPSRPGPIELRLGSLGSAERRTIGSFDSVPVLSPAGFLLYVEGDTLLAQRIDRRSVELVGEPLPIASDVEYSPLYGSLAATLSRDGSLVYQQRRGQRGFTLTRFDRQGAATVLRQDAGRNIDLSPDGGRLAYTRLEDGARAEDVWVLDLAWDTLSRVTFDAAGEVGPVWSPDGDRLAYALPRADRLSILTTDLEASNREEEVHVLATAGGEPVDWSPDGRHLLFESGGPPDLFALPLEAGGEPIPIARAERVAERSGRWSPDGRWIAYASSESGQNEIYVQPFPPDGSRRQVSSGGGEAPRWRADGRELFYVSGGQLIVVPTTTGARFTAGRPQPLFALATNDYEVAPDGQSFYLRHAPASERVALRVVLGWRPTDAAAD